MITLNYILGVSAFMAAFYLFYILLLSKDTQYTRNRRYLLLTLALSLVLPALNINIGTASPLADLQGNISGIFSLGSVNISSPEQGNWNMIFSRPLISIYFLGLIISLTFVLFNTAQVLIMIRKGKLEGTKMVFTEKEGVSGFSAFGYIFISSKLDREDIKRITEHELKHIDYGHFSDLIFIKLVSIILWFNPFVYLFERSIKAIHEYQADDCVIRDGENIIEYQKLLLNQLFQTKFFYVQNAFAGKSLIKKRIIMMTKQKTRNTAVYKLLLILPLVSFLIFLFSCSKDEASKVDKDVVNEIEAIDEIAQEQDKVKTIIIGEMNEKEIFNVVEEMPTFDGGDITKFRKYVQTRVKYPPIAAQNGIQGQVFIDFVVNTDGTVGNVEVTKSVDPSLDNEAIRVIQNSPLWVAGKQEGETVPVKFSITINFQLQ